MAPAAVVSKVSFPGECSPDPKVFFLLLMLGLSGSAVVSNTLPVFATS